VLANQLTLHRKYLRSQVRKLFAPELAAMGEPVGFEMLAAADIMASFESYQLLVEHRALEPVQAQSVMRRALEAIFGSPG
jgi:hypothetical protein